MNPAALSLIALGLDALIKLWANHTGKPVDWQPSAQDWADLKAQVDAATPEAEKAAARARLGITEVMG
jgi:hypothetical protein